MTYIGKDGTKNTVKGKVGDNVLYLAHRWGIDMEGNRNNLQKIHMILF